MFHIPFPQRKTPRLAVSAILQGYEKRYGRGTEKTNLVNSSCSTWHFDQQSSQIWEKRIAMDSHILENMSISESILTKSLSSNYRILN
jgi:hypothetical protein